MFSPFKDISSCKSLLWEKLVQLSGWASGQKIQTFGMGTAHRILGFKRIRESMSLQRFKFLKLCTRSIDRNSSSISRLTEFGHEPIMTRIESDNRRANSLALFFVPL